MMFFYYALVHPPKNQPTARIGQAADVVGLHRAFWHPSAGKYQHHLPLLLFEGRQKCEKLQKGPGEDPHDQQRHFTGTGVSNLLVPLQQLHCSLPLAGFGTGGNGCGEAEAVRQLLCEGRRREKEQWVRCVMHACSIDACLPNLGGFHSLVHVPGSSSLARTRSTEVRQWPAPATRGPLPKRAAGLAATAAQRRRHQAARSAAPGWAHNCTAELWESTSNSTPKKASVRSGKSCLHKVGSFSWGDM